MPFTNLRSQASAGRNPRGVTCALLQAARRLAGRLPWSFPGPDPPLTRPDAFPLPLQAGSLAPLSPDWLPRLSAARTVGFWLLEWLVLMHPGFLPLEYQQPPPAGQLRLCMLGSEAQAVG